ncbi:MAG: hypothetical protein D3M94_07370 [Rhodocyclales bacterium GT-UBC]|nr:MAG: hypothetical protein D3M94_07370 [Rhodocyclales bacterium GT-UBC]
MAEQDYTFAFRRLDVISAALAKAPEMVNEELSRFFAWVLPHLTSEVVDRMPTAEGHLRRSVIGRTEVSPTGMLGIIGTPLDYALPVELGTKPHAVSESGILALAEWAKRKLPLGQAVSLKTGRPLKTPGIDEAALSAAHAIAWKIRHRGTQGAFMFRDAFIANRAMVLQQFDQTVDRIVKRLGSTA